MTVGERSTPPDKTMIYRAGDSFETGDVSHRVNNKTERAEHASSVEILPMDLKGPYLIVPRDKPVSWLCCARPSRNNDGVAHNVHNTE